MSIIKTITKKQVSIILLLAVIIMGSTYILLHNIQRAWAAEDSNVVTGPAIKADLESEDTASNVKATAKPKAATKPKATAKPKAARSPKSIAKPNAVPNDALDEELPEDNPTPTKKDLSVENAKALVAKYIHIFDVNANNGRIEMEFGSMKSSIINRKMWSGRFIPTDKHAIYWCNIDAVTGKLYDITKFGNIKTVDCEKNEISDSLLKKKEYRKIACVYISSHFPDKKIVSSKNIYTGSISGNNGSVNTVSTAVELSDGTGYRIAIGYKSYEVLSITFYPHGVKNYLN